MTKQEKPFRVWALKGSKKYGQRPLNRTNYWNSLLKTLWSMVLIIFLIMQIFPVPKDIIDKTRLYQDPDEILEHGDSYFVQTYTGDVFGWGRSSNRLQTHIDIPYPYLLRRKLAADIKDFSCGMRGAMYVDNDSSLYGWGTLPQGLSLQLDNAQLSPVKLLEDVQDITLTYSGHAMAILKDGSLWVWGMSNHNNLGLPQDVSLQPFAQAPTEIMVHVQKVMILDVTPYVISNQSLYAFLDGPLSKPLKIADGVLDAAVLETGWIQYLSKDGTIYRVRTKEFGNAFLANDDVIARNAKALFKEGYISHAGEMFLWDSATKTYLFERANVAAALQSDFYISEKGRLYVPGLPLSTSLYTVDTRWRNLFIGLLVITAIYMKNKEKITPYSYPLPQKNH